MIGNASQIFKYLKCILLLLVLLTRHANCVSHATTGTHYPVILVPGDGGSQLEAKLDKSEVVHYFCNKKTTDYFDLWLNLELLLPYVLDCWVDNMRLEYDNETRTTKNSPGVDIRVPGFGNTSTIEYLDPSRVSPSSYFAAIVEGLVSVGYTRGVDVRGAPYDYRKAPNELGDYLKNVVNLIEDTYNKNGNSPIVIVCHSMGCPVMLYLMNHQPQSWKDKFIKSLVSLGGAWGGAVKALKAYASGENLGVVVINPLVVRAEQRMSPSLAYVAPSNKFWTKDEILVVTNKRNYTIDDYHDFFNDINFPVGWEMWKDTSNLTHDLIPPNIEIHCLYGSQVNTIERLVYKSDKFPDAQPVLVYGDGDGTVNIRSLEGCLLWQKQQKQKVYNKSFPKVDHMGILGYSGVVEYIKNLALGG